MRLSEPKLFELDPNSVIRLYEVIKEFSEFDLNKLKTENDLNLILNNDKYNIEEKFYIVNYLPKYLDVTNKKTYISNLIKETEEIEDFKDSNILEIIKKYADIINATCIKNQKRLKRIYNYSLKSNLSIDNIKDSAFAEAKYWKRLPLNKDGKQEFLEFIHKQLKDFFPKEDIQVIIENSFDILPIPDKTSLLYFEMVKSGEIRRAFYHIYNEYKKRKEDFKDIADTNEVRRFKPKNQKVINGKLKRADFLPQLDKNEYGKTTDKINIARIMFLTFSKIRENYLIDAKAKNKEDLNAYLKTYCRNIKDCT